MSVQDTKKEIEEFQKQILRFQTEAVSSTEKVEVLKDMLTASVNLLTSLSKQIEASLGELKTDENRALKSSTALTAEIAKFKIEIKNTTTTLTSIKSHLENPAPTNSETKQNTQSAKSGFSTPLSFCYGSQQAAARKKAEAMLTGNKPAPSESDASTKTKG